MPGIIFPAFIFQATLALSPVAPGTGPDSPANGVVHLATTIAASDSCGQERWSQLELGHAGNIAIQKDLRVLGYETGGLDGILGKRSRASIRHWQSTGACTPTGYLTQEQMTMLREQAKKAAATAEQSHPRQPNKEPSDSRQKAKAQESGLNLSELDRTRVERLLEDAGFDPGPSDGIFDPRTRKAIAAYQKQWGFPQTGFLDEVTYVRMLADGILR